MEISTKKLRKRLSIETQLKKMLRFSPGDDSTPKGILACVDLCKCVASHSLTGLVFHALQN